MAFDYIFFSSSREMILLDDLTDGETSDGGVPGVTVIGGIRPGGVHHNNLRGGHPQQPFPAKPEPDFEFDGGNSTSGEQYLSNTNTLETMSARSFGFVKPSPKQRESDFANRLRRHKSFFNAESSSSSTGHLYQQQQSAQQGPKHRRGSLMRRAESFHHSRSLGDFDQIINGPAGQQNSGAAAAASNNNININSNLHQQLNSNVIEHLRSRGKSVERLLSNAGDSQHHQQQHHQQSGGKALSKSKSMEFLKAKLLSRKPSTKLQQQQQQQQPQPQTQQTQQTSNASPQMGNQWDLRGGSPGRTGAQQQTTTFFLSLIHI